MSDGRRILHASIKDPNLSCRPDIYHLSAILVLPISHISLFQQHVSIRFYGIQIKSNKYFYLKSVLQWKTLAQGNITDIKRDGDVMIMIVGMSHEGKPWWWHETAWPPICTFALQSQDMIADSAGYMEHICRRLAMVAKYSWAFGLSLLMSQFLTPTNAIRCRLFSRASAPSVCRGVCSIAVLFSFLFSFPSVWLVRDSQAVCQHHLAIGADHRCYMLLCLPCHRKKESSHSGLQIWQSSRSVCPEWHHSLAPIAEGRVISTVACCRPWQPQPLTSLLSHQSTRCALHLLYNTIQHHLFPT